MVSDLDTFAKVRALHDRTDSPGEKAAAAGRMNALAQAAGMTVAEAVTKLDRAAAQTPLGAGWPDFADVLRRAAAAEEAANAPDAQSRRYGVPIYDPDKIERWWTVAQHCLQLDWMIPKARGGKFLTKDQRVRMKAVAQYGSVTNATADWLEAVLARCEIARKAWRDRGMSGVRPDPKATESDIEKAAEMIASAERREASNVDTPEPEVPPEPPTRAQATADAFNAFFNTPEMRAERAERETKRQAKCRELLAEYGSEDAVWAATDREAALRRACEPLLGSGQTWNTIYQLDGWGSFESRSQMPGSVRRAVTEAWLLPTTVAEAWAEYEAAEKLDNDRCAFCPDYTPHTWAEARRYILEDLCQTLPARSLHDLRCRLSWMEHVARLDIARSWEEQAPTLQTLRADIERMGTRIRGEDADVQTGHGDVCSPDLGTAAPPVHSGQQRRTNANKRRDVLALLNAESSGTGPLTDREIARRVGVSPQTVGNIRRRSHEAG